eukprot:Skav215168  [mRNA]  locus=scaffold4227:43183:49414:+ [translate_table: standard]
MDPQQRNRSYTLAKWIGARCTSDVVPGTELLVAARNTPSVLFDGLHILAKAQMMPFDKAEVVIVADTSRSLYKEARKRGQQVAPPKWLERCLQIRCALQIAGELEEYLEAGPEDLSPPNLREDEIRIEKGRHLLRWTLEHGAPGKTWAGELMHLVLFNVLPETAVVVSVPTDKEIVQQEFRDEHLKRFEELKVRSTGAEDVADAVLAMPPTRAAPDLAPLPPVTDIEPCISPPLSEGVFSGLVLGMAGWPNAEETQIVEQICAEPSLLQSSVAEAAGKRQIPLVS